MDPRGGLAEILILRSLRSKRLEGWMQRTDWRPILRDAAKRPLLRMRKKNRNRYRTTPEMKPGLRRGGFISFFRKQCASLPTYPGRA
jgi:hypothetical protein